MVSPDSYSQARKRSRNRFRKVEMAFMVPEWHSIIFRPILDPFYWQVLCEKVPKGWHASTSPIVETNAREIEIYDLRTKNGFSPGPDTCRRGFARYLN